MKWTQSMRQIVKVQLHKRFDKTYNHKTTSISDGIANDNCSWRHECRKYADKASKPIPTGYAIRKAMLIQER